MKYPAIPVHINHATNSVISRMLLSKDHFFVIFLVDDFIWTTGVGKLLLLLLLL